MNPRKRRPLLRKKKRFQDTYNISRNWRKSRKSTGIS
jgi:hypothetical protein